MMRCCFACNNGGVTSDSTWYLPVCLDVNTTGLFHSRHFVLTKKSTSVTNTIYIGSLFFISYMRYICSGWNWSSWIEIQLVFVNTLSVSTDHQTPSTNPAILNIVEARERKKKKRKMATADSKSSLPSFKFGIKCIKLGCLFPCKKCYSIASSACLVMSTCQISQMQQTVIDIWQLLCHLWRKPQTPFINHHILKSYGIRRNV